jgi:tetratricopeptide (TPR) repeat protein
MKALRYLFILIYLTGSPLAFQLQAQEAAPTPSTSESETIPKASETPKAPEPPAPPVPEAPTPGSELIPKALQLFLAKKYPECIEITDQILKINPNYHDAYNLKGAAYTKMKNWQAAEASFRQALSASPMAFEPKFNLAELLFLQGKYPEARQSFIAILEHSNLDIYKHLTEFKIFLTYLLEDNIEAATQIASKFDGFETTPIHYFTQGALHYKKGDRPKAMGYFDSAARIFPARLNHNYADTLIELGWIQVNKKGMLDDPDAPTHGPSILLKTESNEKLRAVQIIPAHTPVSDLPAENNPQSDKEDKEIKNPFNNRSNIFREEIEPK